MTVSDYRPATEQEVRAMRDRVYGTTGDVGRDNNNWEGCKHHWLKPEEVAWLRAKLRL